MAVTDNPRTKVGPRQVPSVEVDPTNELLDGDALPLPEDLEDAGVVIDPSGTRLENEWNPAEIPPPAYANLELRLRQEKELDAADASIGAGAERPDEWVTALEAERDSLKSRAEYGFGEAKDRAQNRLEQVERALSDRNSRKERRTRVKAAHERLATRREASGDDAGHPQGVTLDPSAKTTAAQETKPPSGDRDTDRDRDRDQHQGGPAKAAKATTVKADKA